MSTARQRKANRRNANASTGPRTAKGQARSAQNARRHGLSVAVLADPVVSREVQDWARVIAGDAAGPEGMLIAHKIAEAQIDLVRVRKARQDLLARNLNNPNYRSPVDDPLKAIREVEMFFKTVDRIHAGADITIDEVENFKKFSKRSDRKENLAVILLDHHKQLARLDRYERRALSRRNTAMRAFDATLRS